ncbi:MAG TPA: PaaI family thioesterase [Candidatus Limnocylindria bacterium]|nr:PaaI family thioesterase [Candidatus Limnocylindria bacterium]
MTASLQERYAPRSICFGCGPANENGLRIRSFEEDGAVVADWRPEPHHEAFPGVLNGGIVGALLDCHSNWTAAVHLMRARRMDHVPPCVTAEYAVKMRKPTPTDRPLRIEARVAEATEDRATVEARILADGAVTATCRGTFVAVGPGHPAYDRWDE